MRIISIDIAYKKPIAYCVMSERGKITKLAEIKPANDIYHTATVVLEAIIPYGECLVITETPLMIHNINTAFMMARMHAMLEKGVRDSGSTFFGIHPATWQAKLLHPKSGDDRKLLSIKEAWKFMSETKLDHPDPESISNDIADAINLARFGHMNKKEIFAAIRGEGKFSEK